MKLNLFKKLIKEAVAEAVREELNNIINEQFTQQKPNYIQENKTLSFTSDDVITQRTQIREKMGNMFGFNAPPQPNNVIQLDSNLDNPYLSFIKDAENNMTPQERLGLKNLG